MTKAALEKSVVDTARIAEEWASNVSKIEVQIANAHSRLEKSESQRKRFALDASLKNPDAIAGIAKARAEQSAAEGDQADLSHALSQAKARTIEAESEAKIARKDLAGYQAELQMRQRIQVAARLDAVIAEFSLAFQEFEKLGHQIATVPDLFARNMHGAMSQAEEIAGDLRVRSALPKWFLKFFPGALHHERPQMSLEASEIQTWNLAPAETTTAAAA